ncbi:putative bifunctional diguanylate cyclase/phosphodiesterase [Geodermatophilus amargosae]|uniref:putative bifunctional diguanylate cyclase/phosphodiesterase n=1 Tax=Geodermatophilus amargosae TaxID=1296565 RepID=UPI0034DF9F37
MAGTVITAVVFSSGVIGRPSGAGWATFFDLWLYNVVFLCAAVVCWLAAGRHPAEGLAWRALAVALLLTTAGNVIYTTYIAALPVEPYPSLADALWLSAYAARYVGLIGLIRAQVTRFPPSLWLDGLIGALGAAAAAIAFLLGPTLRLVEGDTAAVIVNLAYPVADILLLALLVAVGAMVGLRGDRTVWLVAVALAANLLGDIVYLDLAAVGVYVEGGLLDLAWVLSAVLMAWAAAQSRPRARPATAADESARVGWRVLAVPFTCNVVSLALLGAGWSDQFPRPAAWCAVGCVLAALVRTALTFREVRAFALLREQATTDELTGLANRRALFDRADAILGTRTTSQPSALLLMDLDGFKEVNDSLGHHAGDLLLRQVGPRIAGLVGAEDVLARLGGDEFAVLLADAALEEATATAHRVREALLQPFLVDGVRLHVGVSVGVATAPVPASTMTELLRCADVAMYTAKTARDGVRAYVPEPGNGAGGRLRMMEELRVALATDQLEVHLQPQVSLRDGRPVGAEALIRWRHPERGVLAPAEFLPAIEQAGLQRPLADAVLQLALTAVARWWPDWQVPVSVNLAAVNVTDLDLPLKVSAALQGHGLPAAALAVELVEDTLMTDPDRGRTVLESLRQLGVRTSIDDYGTGYSSLSYLSQLPADELKLDRAFTHELSTRPRTTVIVRHTVALAHDLGLRLVAEGVEDAATAHLLAALGCDVVQGYFIARPMPVDAFIEWLAAVEAPERPPSTLVGH